MTPKFKINRQNIFLIDGLGASLSAIFSGLILPLFSEKLGIPPWLLYGMATIAVTFCIYSLFVHFGSKAYRPEFLLAIILANFTYCIFSTILIIFWPGVTFYGRLVLAYEAIVVLGVIAIEVRVLLKKRTIE